MYIISKINKNEDDNIPILEHSRDVFHKAYEHKLKKAHVHLKNDEYYDIIRIKNSKYQPPYIQKRYPGQIGFFEYEYYDEDNISGLYLDYLKRFDIVLIQQVNEYSIVIAKLILKHTNAIIYCFDNRMQWFIKNNEKLHYVNKKTNDIKGEILTIATLDKDKQLDIERKNMGPIGAFHNVFFMQGTGIIDFSNYKYVEIMFDKNAGIGSIINNASRFKTAFLDIGLKLTCRQNKIGHFPLNYINEVLNLDINNIDANDSNTIFIEEIAPYIITYFLLQHTNPIIDSSILNDKFKNEMLEYANELFNGKKMLGVLIRGTDYNIINTNDLIRMATVDEMIPIIDDYIEKYKFDAIFLATEDQDIFEQMRNKYGKMLYVVNQERHRISDMKNKTLLADLELLEHEKEYEETIIENTTNYLYALYLLSQCNSFICSGVCNGYHLVKAFNEGKFEYILYFKAGKVFDGKKSNNVFK